MLPRPSHRSRLRARSLSGPSFAVLGLVLVGVAGLFATLLIVVHSLDSVSDANRDAPPGNQRALQLERIAVGLEPGVRGYMLPHDRRFLEPYLKGRTAIAPRERELLRLSPPAQRPVVRRIRADLNDYVRGYAEPIVSRPAPTDRAPLLRSEE